MSDSPGYLVPIGPIAPYDDQLLDLLQPVIVGIAGYIDPTLVRPRWQTKNVPNMLEYTVDWLAFGIARTRPDTYHFEGHVDNGEGYDVFEHSEEIDLLISCYGPRSQSFARLLSNGFRIEQNRAVLNANSIDTLFIGDPVTLPALLHNVWVRRVDLTVTLRRYVTSNYGIKTIVDLSTGSGVNNELYITPLNVET